MTSAVETIEKVLQSDLLSQDLITIPSEGATEVQIKEECHLLGRQLSPQYRELLRRWNGVDLDVIRLYGCGKTMNGIKRLSEMQRPSIEQIIPKGLVIGSDPAGFIYIEGKDGMIHSLETDGGEVTFEARDLDDFLGRLVFGEDAASFAGEDWKTELLAAGLIK